MKAKSVRYRTTITGIEQVTLRGKVCYDSDLECYTIGGDSVEYWLERIADSDQSQAFVNLILKVNDGKEDDAEIIEKFKPLGFAQPDQEKE